MALLKHALTIAADHEIPDAISRAQFNLANDLMVDDRYEEALAYDLKNLELALRLGRKNDATASQVHLARTICRRAESSQGCRARRSPCGCGRSPLRDAHRWRWICVWTASYRYPNGLWRRSARRRACCCG